MLIAALVLALVAMRYARRSPASALTDVLNSKDIGNIVEKHLPELVIAAAIGGLILGLRRKK